MLYTTYLSNMKNVPDDCLKLIITRFPPKWFNANKYPLTYIIKELSPSKELLLKYKQNNNWDWYVKSFKEEMNNRQDMKYALKELEGLLNNNQDVCLVCYEKDYERCHRSIIGQYFEQKRFKWKEL